ncbi:MAG: VWA domain-containing protein [Proteobacteria bacterium]|nr:VWA domain-containing protein [Pseudomonadota bacterium]
MNHNTLINTILICFLGLAFLHCAEDSLDGDTVYQYSGETKNKEILASYNAVPVKVEDAMTDEKDKGKGIASRDKDGDGQSEVPIEIEETAQTVPTKFELVSTQRIDGTTETVDVSIDFFVLLDVTGSMTHSNFAATKTALLELMGQLLGKQYRPRITLIPFKHNLLPVSGPHNTKQKLIAGFNLIAGYFDDRGGDEAGLNAMWKAIQLIKEYRKQPNGQEKIYAILLVADEPSWLCFPTNAPHCRVANRLDPTKQTLRTEEIVQELNSLKFHERIKLFASLRNTTSTDSVGPIKTYAQFDGILKQALTHVTNVSDRGARLAHDLTDTDPIASLVPRIQRIIPAVNLTCVLKEVTAGLPDNNTKKIVISDMDIRDSKAHVSNLLEGTNIQPEALAGETLEMTEKRCCVETTTPPTTYTADNLPATCLSEQSKTVTFDVVLSSE